MATCKDCLHVEVYKDYAINYLKGAPIEALEKEVGDYPCCRIVIRFLQTDSLKRINFNEIGKTVFFTKEAAEQALKERESNA